MLRAPKEFDGMKALHDEYVAALTKTYVVPKVVDDRPVP